MSAYDKRVSKKILNEVDSCVRDSLHGYASLHTGVRLLEEDYRVVVRADLEEVLAKKQVVILTGGGSGHEPAFVGYLGSGMASIAVHGAINASPPPGPILTALRQCGSNHKAGIIMVINNYTGDLLNFGLARERALADGINVKMLVNDDDSAVLPNTKKQDRRGLAGLILLLKIVGAMSEQGKSCDEIFNRGQEVAKNIYTLGCCLSPGSPPGSTPLFNINKDQIELGLGLHGEQGVKSVPMQSAKSLVQLMIDHLTDSSNPNHVTLSSGCKVVVLVNNLGSVTELEMNIVVGEVIKQLEHKRCVVSRVYMHRFVTSMEMAGFSLTLMPAATDDQILQYLDCSCRASAWVTPNISLSSASHTSKSDNNLPVQQTTPTSDNSSKNPPFLDKDQAVLLKQAIQAACVSLISMETHLNQLDSHCGDGDCGASHRAGAQAIITAFTSGTLSTQIPYKLLQDLSQLIEENMGGASGALYSLFFASGAQGFEDQCSLSATRDALDKGLQALMLYSGASPGDRSMVDPLAAASNRLRSAEELTILDFKDAVQAAEESAKKTAFMTARVGRASRVRTDLVNQADPGAVAVATWMQALLQTFLRRL